MTLISKNFSEVITFSRGTGATRVNSAGLIVGVDFSTTSNTIATGSKTFTLAADLNVNRDWPVGSNVITVAQAGATGSMTGTVTSYTPSTQSLVINVVSVTGSGTSTDWRIGSLEMREDYDPVTLVRKGVLSEVAATNASLGSDDLSGYTGTAVTETPNFALSPSGSNNARRLQGTGATSVYQRAASIVSGRMYTISVYAKAANAGVNATFRLIGDGNLSSADMTATATFVRYKYTFTAVTGGSRQHGLVRPTNNADWDIVVFGFCVEEATDATSYIPTTTAQVTRNADNFPLTATALTSIRQGESTLYAEIDCPDTGVAQKRALRLSGVNADIRIGKQGTGTLSNFTKMAEGAGLRLMGTATNLIRGNGQDLVGVTAINDRNGVASAVGVTNAIAFDGVNRFALGSGTEEAFIDGLLGTFSGKGAGLNAINGVHHNGNRFIAAHALAGVVFLSDGTSYRRVNTPVITQPTNEVTSGLVGGTLRNVIVGGGGFIATSDDDGETWAARTSGTTQILNGASFGSVGGTNYFIVAGNTGNLRFSTDAITYTNATGQGAGGFIDVHIANNISVSVGGNGAIFYSTNGTTYTAATNTNTTQQLNGVTYSQSLNLWIAVGNAGTITTATDPTGTWTVQTSGTAQNLLEATVFNNAIYIVGATQTLLTSTNGTSYTSLSAGVTANLVGIAASPTTLLITGANGAMASSTDGTTFTSRTNNSATLNGIAFGNNTFVSVGNSANGSGYIATIAADGTVTRRVSGTTASMTNVRFLGDQFYALNQNINFRRSTNGEVWAEIPVSADVGYIHEDIARNGNVFVVALSTAAGTTRTIRRSTDNGASWLTITITGVTPSATGQLRGVDFANNIFVLVGQAGTIVTLDANGDKFTILDSAASDVPKHTLWSLIVSTLTTAFNASFDGVTFFPVYYESTAYSLTTSTNRFHSLNRAAFEGVKFVQIVSGTAEGASRIIRVISGE